MAPFRGGGKHLVRVVRERVSGLPSLPRFRARSFESRRTSSLRQVNKGPGAVAVSQEQLCKRTNLVKKNHNNNPQVATRASPSRRKSHNNVTGASPLPFLPHICPNQLNVSSGGGGGSPPEQVRDLLDPDFGLIGEEGREDVGDANVGPVGGDEMQDGRFARLRRHSDVDQ